MAEQTAEEKAAAIQQEAHASLVKKAEEELKSARAAQLAAAKPTITSFAGIVGRPFVLYGDNLAAQRELKINGHTARLTAVRATSIKGIVPVDVKAGPAKFTLGALSFDGKVSA